MSPNSDDFEAPQLAESDQLDITTREHPFRFRDKDLGQLVVDAVNAMGGVGHDAEDRYQRALRPLRERADKVVELVGSRQGLGSLSPDAYVDRWSLVQLLAELEHPAAVAPLADILDTTVPAERGGDPHSFSTVREELVIRTTAVDALERLSRRGIAEARDPLWRHIDDEQFTVRRACVQALVAVSDDDELERLRRQLEQRDEAWLLVIRRTDVRQVPQAEGGLFLRAPEGPERDVEVQVPPLDDATDQHPELDAVIDKARRLAAHLLGVGLNEVVRLPDGRFGVRGKPEQALSIGELADAAHDPTQLPEGMQPGLGPGSGYGDAPEPGEGSG